jgi:hypothetical protein
MSEYVMVLRDDLAKLMTNGLYVTIVSFSSCRAQLRADPEVDIRTHVSRPAEC